LRFHVRDRYAADTVCEAELEWVPGAPWWTWSRAAGGLSRRTGRVLVRQSPYEVLRAVQDAVVRRDFVAARGHFEDTVRRAVATSDEVAFRVTLVRRLAAVEPFRRHRETLTGLHRARLTLQKPLAEAQVLFRMEGDAWRVDRSFLIGRGRQTERRRPRRPSPVTPASR